MKQHHSIFPPAASLACALILMLAACTSDALDELPPAGTDPDARPLTITVSDGGMYATGQTRAQECGYRTVFTEGDCIGLYVVKDGTLEVKNLCLTLQGGKWTLPAGASRLLYSPGRSYHAYYPYRDDSYMNGNVSPDNGDFFKTVVDAWDVKTNQRTYADYTASDLMTARGVYSNHTLSFAMEHRMSLLILQVPAAKYTYTEKIDGQEISKSYYRYTAVISKNSCWQENPYTARLLVNTKKTTVLEPGPYKYYYAGAEKTFKFKYSQLNLQPGKYTVHKVDDSEVIEELRPLEAGDYYMRDGSIVPQDAFANGSLPADVQADCLGVVFWVGENEGHHWTQTDFGEGDHLLMRDHPECVHGMAVALRDASPTAAAWATGEGVGTYLFYWANGFSGFTPAEQADWKAIKASGSDYGYCSSRLMKLYGTHYPATTFPAYNQIDAYAAAHPAPDGSSGWFFPGKYELAMMCYGMTGNYGGLPTTRRNLLNGLFPKAGGEAFDGIYWSNYGDGTEAWTIDFAGRTAYNPKPKSDTHKVRAVLAF